MWGVVPLALCIVVSPWPVRSAQPARPAKPLALPPWLAGACAPGAARLLSRVYPGNVPPRPCIRGTRCVHHLPPALQARACVHPLFPCIGATRCLCAPPPPPLQRQARDLEASVAGWQANLEAQPGLVEDLAKAEQLGAWLWLHRSRCCTVAHAQRGGAMCGPRSPAPRTAFPLLPGPRSSPP